jgi:hypothetical protein
LQGNRDNKAHMRDLTLLLRDLIHWADEQGVEWDAVVKVATEIHDREVSDIPIEQLDYQLATA